MHCGRLRTPGQGQGYVPALHHAPITKPSPGPMPFVEIMGRTYEGSPSWTTSTERKAD
ncbi:MAG: hypothetical protein USCAAHI_02452 [Beijerinckiaceae bacterium]|nr:MAG: hypothetical protein USCAAHI_02452 [Beijerinckiaceae bacterium]